MKKIGQFLQNKRTAKRGPLDESSVFYVFSKIIREEYGKKGAKSLRAEQFSNKKLFIRAENTNWANEAWLNRESLIEEINRELGGREIEGISVK